MEYVARNQYAVLHVLEDSDPAAIRHASRILARRYHPDAGIGSSAQKFRDVTEPMTCSAILNDDMIMTLIGRGAEHTVMSSLSR